MTDRVLVTGASGFIGHHLVNALLERNRQVRCLVRPTSDLSSLPTEQLELVTGDVLDPPSLAQAASGVGTVYHLAGEIDASARKRLYRVNVQGAGNLAAACAAVAKPPTLILVSTLEAGGPALDDRPRNERDPAQPVTHYGRSKLQGERAAAAYAQKVPITVVRTPSVFGEYDRQTLNLFRSFRLGGLGLHGLPQANRQQLSLIHAGELAEFLLLAAERGERLEPDRGEREGVGLYYPTQGEMTLGQAIRTVAKALDQGKVTVIDLPVGVAYAATALAEAWAKISGRPPGIMTLDKARAAAAGWWTCDGEKSRRLGFEPQRSLEQRLQQTARWYQEQGWLS